MRRRRFPFPVLSLQVLLLATGCDRGPRCESYEPYPELRNHVQPFEIAVDAERRRAFSTSLASRTVGVYDLDWSAVIAMVPIGPRPLVYPDVAVDELGAAWITSFGHPPLIRLDPDTGERAFPESGLSLARRVVAVPGGGAVVLGVDRDDRSVLVRHAADGSVGAEVPMDVDGLGLVPLAGEQVGVLVATAGSGAMEIHDLDTLDLSASCEVGFPASRGAQLADGAVLVTSRTMVGRAGCGGEPALTWVSGIENQDVVALGDGSALVLDRIGADDPNLGVARRWGRDGPLDEAGFATAKNTGYGALDPATGRVWANSEGTSDVVWLDPDAGAVAGDLRTGTHLDGLALDPETEGGLVLSGRLSDSILRLEVFHDAVRTDEVPWPFSPVVDPERGRVWVLSQTTAAVHGLELDTLATRERYPTGDPPNGLLTFGGLALHPERRTLLVAESAADALIEIDPSSGEERGRWPLGGPPVVDPDLIGQLALHPLPGGDAALVCRTTDGRIQRVDLASDEVRTAWLDAVELAGLGEGNAVDSVAHLPDAGLIYVGGIAFDTASLDRRPDADRDVLRIVGPDPTDTGGAVIAVDPGGRRLLRLGPEGDLLGELTLADHEVRASLFQVDPLRERVLVLRSADARLCSFPIADIR